VHDVAALAEVVLEVLPRRAVREVAHVAAAAHAHDAALVGLGALLLGRGLGGLAGAGALEVPVLAVLAHLEGPAVELRVVQRLDGRRRLGRVLELDNPTTLGAARGLLHHVRVDHGAAGAEVVLEVLPGGAPGEVADVDAPRDDDLVAVLGHALLGRLRRPVGALGAAAGLVLLVLAHEDVAAAEVRAVERLYRVRGLLGRLELDDAAALGAAGALLHDLGVHDVARGAEVVLEVLPRGLPREVVHVAAAPRAAAAAAVLLVAAAAAASLGLAAGDHVV